MPTIHGVNASPFVRKVRVVMQEKGLDYELEPVMPGGVPAGFTKISPLSKVPVYQDGDYVLPDSSCIAVYLERLHPDPPLLPSDPKLLGRALWYEEYADTKVVEVLGTIFAQRVVVAKIMKGKPDAALIERKLTEEVPPVLDYLEGEVGEGEGIVGDRFSLADIALASPFVNFEHAGEQVDAARWPRLAAYLARVLGRPSFARLVEEEKKGLAALG